MIAPPRNQANCNACSSFAVAAAIGARLSIAKGRLIEVSAGFLHTCLGHAGISDPAAICGGPIDLNAMVNLVAGTGYALAAPNDYPFPPASCRDVTIAGQIEAVPAIIDVTDAKTQIVADGPIVADMYIWPDFFTYSTADTPTYSPDMTRPGFEVHSVCVVGFNTRAWIIKNSMGPAWGDGQGFAEIAYGDCMLIKGPAGDPPPGLYPREAFALQLPTGVA